MSEFKNEGDEVGYKRPPKASRFKPGQSGNPRGRPSRPTKTLEDFKFELLNRRVQIFDNGVRKSITAAEAIVRKKVANALGGDQKAIKFLFQSPSNMDGPPMSTHIRALEVLDRMMADVPPADEEKRVKK